MLPLNVNDLFIVTILKNLELDAMNVESSQLPLATSIIIPAFSGQRNLIN